MGYLIVAVLFVVLLGGLLAVFAGKNGRRVGRGVLPSRHPVARTKPSADAPAPDTSVVAGSAQREKASRHTPPA